MLISQKVTSWGGKLTRQFDKLTNGKKYVFLSLGSISSR